MTDQVSESTPGGGWVPVPDPTLLTNQAIAQVTREYRRELAQVKELMAQRVDNLQGLLDERYATQTKALDAAFVAAEKAVATALASAEKAVATAERANERRFEGVNEFRKALSDQTATFLPRPEYTTAHEALEDKLNGVSERMSTMELRLTSRLDTAGGALAGEHAQRTEARAQGMSSAQLVGVIIAALALIGSIIALVLK